MLKFSPPVSISVTLYGYRVLEGDRLKMRSYYCAPKKKRDSVTETHTLTCPLEMELCCYSQGTTEASVEPEQTLS
jgi:hypothetical protein